MLKVALWAKTITWQNNHDSLQSNLLTCQLDDQEWLRILCRADFIVWKLLRSGQGGNFRLFQHPFSLGHSEGWKWVTYIQRPVEPRSFHCFRSRRGLHRLIFLLPRTPHLCRLDRHRLSYIHDFRSNWHAFSTVSVSNRISLSHFSSYELFEFDFIILSLTAVYWGKVHCTVAVWRRLICTSFK